jgi:acetyl-CoA C-acetyltransferase
MKDVACRQLLPDRDREGDTRRAQPDAWHPDGAHVMKRSGRGAGEDRGGEIEDVVLGCGLPKARRATTSRARAALCRLRRRRARRDGEPLLRLGPHGCVLCRQRHRDAARSHAGIAGGVESISLVQFNLNFNGFFYEPLQRVMPAVWWTMNQTADFVAQKYGIPRQRSTSMWWMSQKRVAGASAAGKYAEEITPFTTTMKVTDKATGQSREVEVTLDHDEGPRPDTTSRGAREAEAGVRRRHDNGWQCLAAL